MVGALVVPVLGVGWVRNGDLFLSFRCQPYGHRAWRGGGRAGCSVIFIDWSFG